jgi:anti-anti-sigma factor
MAPESTFHYTVEESVDHSNLLVTTIKCRGRMLGESALRIKHLVKPLIDAGGRHVIIDLTDLEWLDSAGLGALVGLKVSALNKGLCKLDLVNLSPRIRELMNLTHLNDLFAK